MNKLFFVVALLLTVSGLSAQKFFTKTGVISFHSEAPLETIEAVNNKATSVLDAESGRLEFALLIKAFQFEKALMQEHFNENYMESSEFPKSTFKGQLTDASQVDWTTPGTYDATVTGDLTIHGVTKSVTAPAKLIVKSDGIDANATFTVAVADYGIEIPNVVRDNIAKEVDITVAVNYEPLKQ